MSAALDLNDTVYRAEFSWQAQCIRTARIPRAHGEETDEGFHECWSSNLAILVVHSHHLYLLIDIVFNRCIPIWSRGASMTA